MLKQLFPALRATLVLAILTGLLYPLAVFGLSQLLFKHQAQGSLIRNAQGQALGSELIGQNFSAPRYFHPRPSAAGSGYDAASSSGTNLGPTNAKLINGTEDDPATPDTDESFLGVKQLAQAYRQENNLPDNAPLPVDAVTRSGSGLDPHISPTNAALQAPRVAKERGLTEERVRELVRQNIENRQLGFLGEPRVNVLKLNLALDQASGGR